MGTGVICIVSDGSRKGVVGLLIRYYEIDVIVTWCFEDRYLMLLGWLTGETGRWLL